MRRPDDRGSTIPLIIGFAMILLVLVAVVVDVSAAFLRRQNLDSLADGAALHGADFGAQGANVYSGGLAEDWLELTRAAAHASVADYLRQTDAYGRYPGLRFDVTVDDVSQRVEVTVATPFDLPLGVPGATTRTTVRATGSASVYVER